MSVARLSVDSRQRERGAAPWSATRMRPVCRQRSRWCAGISRFPRRWIAACKIYSDRPQSLTQAEQVHTIGRAIGRSLRVEEISPDEARSELIQVLGSSTVVNMLINAWAAALGQPAFVTSTFSELTGAPPRTFLEWATDHAAEFRA